MKKDDRSKCPRVVRGAINSGKSGAMHSGKKVMNLRIRSLFYIFFLNPDYVATRSLRSLHSNEYVVLLIHQVSTFECMQVRLKKIECQLIETRWLETTCK